MNEIIQSIDWTQVIVTIITVVIAPLIVLLLNETKKWVHAKTDNELLIRFSELALNAVAAANQEMVESLKKEEKFDAAKAIEVKEIVKMKFFSYLNEQGRKELDRLIKDVDNFISDAIEAKVGELKAIQ